MINIEKLSKLSEKVIELHNDIRSLMTNIPLETKEFLKNDLENYKHFGLSNSTVVALSKHAITNGRDLASLSKKQLKKVPRIGEKAYKEIEQLLFEKGIILEE